MPTSSTTTQDGGVTDGQPANGEHQGGPGDLGTALGAMTPENSKPDAWRVRFPLGWTFGLKPTNRRGGWI